MGSAEESLCEQCREPGADMDTLLCSACLLALPPFFRMRAEQQAIHVALLRQALVGGKMGAVRWSEQQLRDHLRKAQSPPEREARKAPKPAAAHKCSNPRTLVFELELLPTNNHLHRMHFTAKRKLMGRISDALRPQIPLSSGCPLARAKVEIIRYSSVKPDREGLWGGMKPLLDAMQVASKRHPYGAYIIEDDSDRCIDLDVRWEKCAPRCGKIVVLVTPIP